MRVEKRIYKSQKLREEYNWFCQHRYYKIVIIFNFFVGKMPNLTRKQYSFEISFQYIIAFIDLSKSEMKVDHCGNST